MSETVNPTTSQMLLSRYKEVLELPSDYAVAKNLDVTPQAVQQWQAGKPMSNDNALRIAEALELDWSKVVAALERDRAKTPESRARWEKYCARVLVAAFVALGAVHPKVCEARHNPPDLATVSDFTTYTLCVLWMRRFIAALKSAFRPRRAQRLRPLALLALIA